MTADGADDTRRCHGAIIVRGATAIIPDPEEWSTMERGLPGRPGAQRNSARHALLWQGVLEAVDRIPPGSRVEAKMRSFKSFGERIAAKIDPDRQTAEIHIRVALINRFNAPNS